MRVVNALNNGVKVKCHPWNVIQAISAFKFLEYNQTRAIIQQYILESRKYFLSSGNVIILLKCAPDYCERGGNIAIGFVAPPK